ncbi:phosphatidate cytidylyltransferase [Phytophthora pseudosyringae]|uniref:Phosphatidate cytidylyltransferase n=1 Tax=Phytophthora pseudosyringae TaxID=221518 RepID=A0A8T1W2H7_9STRA|nr:phosphatidate cytidylyltransferase [Phytophthora pseudosyringae]
MADTPVDERFSLRVRNLPAVLSAEAITSLFSHYGATRVRLLQRRNATSSGKEPGAAAAKKLQKAVATFVTREAQHNAQRRLHSLELAGHYLQVEVVGDDAAATSTEVKPEAKETESNEPLSAQPPLPKGFPPPLPPTPAPMQNPLYAPAPLAPHLGFTYAPSPLLEYKYPKATENIVRNIANALIALPRFYTQVLHLMNKMNLPPPFEEDAIPGRFSRKQDATHETGETRRKHLKRRRTDDSLKAQIVEEEEEEKQNNGDVSATGSNTQTAEVLPRPEAQHMREAANNVADSDKAGHKSSGQGPLPELIGNPLAQQSKLLSIKKSTTLNTAFQIGADNRSHQHVHQSTRPGVISENEVNRQRLAPEELLKEPLMEFYVRGFPSRSVMVNNIAHGVDTKDMCSVFGYALPTDVALDSMKITLLPAKGSAQITYPDEQMATVAVNELHGVQLEGRALIVSFHNTLGEVPTPTVERWTLEMLASKRLPKAQITSEKVMKKYQRGEPSNSLYVKNLAKTVELADLFAVFGAVLPHESGLETLNIRHFTVGRMKCQAFVTFPTADLASSALLHVHGVVLKDKPVIVCFRKPQTD